MPSLGGSGRYGGDDHNGGYSGGDPDRDSNAGKHDDRKNLPSAGRDDDYDKPINDQIRQDNSGKHDDRNSGRRTNPYARGGESPRTVSRRETRRIRAVAPYGGNSLTGSKLGGNFGGWDGDGSPQADYDVNQSYYKKKVGDKRQREVVNAAEKVAQDGIGLRSVAGIASGAIPSVKAGLVSINPATTALDVLEKQRLEQINTQGEDEEQAGYLEHIKEQITNPKKNLIEHLAPVGGAALAGVLSGGNPVAMGAGASAGSAWANGRATSRAADRFRSPEEREAINQERAIARKEQAKKTFMEELYRDDKSSGSGLYAANTATPAQPASTGLLAQPTYTFDYNTHLTNFTRG